jgi:hypothetical protein
MFVCSVAMKDVAILFCIKFNNLDKILECCSQNVVAVFRERGSVPLE